MTTAFDPDPLARFDAAVADLNPGLAEAFRDVVHDRLNEADDANCPYWPTVSDAWYGVLLAFVEPVTARERLDTAVGQLLIAGSEA